MVPFSPRLSLEKVVLSDKDPSLLDGQLNLCNNYQDLLRFILCHHSSSIHRSLVPTAV
jgi:hypothetical protein